MTAIIFDASHTRRSHYEAHRQKGSHYWRKQRHRSGHGPSFHCGRCAGRHHWSRPERTLDEAVRALGPNARGYRADLTIAEDRKQLFAALAKDFGKLDIVFANA